MNRNLTSLRLAAALAAGQFLALTSLALAGDAPKEGAPADGGAAFKIVASDDSADVTEINVKKGDKVSITFTVDANRTYHNGLEFRSAQVDSGSIRPGESKTVTFVADSTFSFTPYWPSSNRRKPYTIKVTVQ